MRIALRLLGVIRRVFPFLWNLAGICGRSLFLILPRALHNFVWRELVWRWWLGYGESPFRVLFAIALILAVTWLLYWQAGTFLLETSEGDHRAGRPSWQDALYYSLISFSALGYGSWAPQPLGWARWVGAVQPFFGIISAVALSINLTQRVSR